MEDEIKWLQPSESKFKEGDIVLVPTGSGMMYCEIIIAPDGYMAYKWGNSSNRYFHYTKDEENSEMSKSSYRGEIGSYED